MIGWYDVLLPRGETLDAVPVGAGGDVGIVGDEDQSAARFNRGRASYALCLLAPLIKGGRA